MEGGLALDLRIIQTLLRLGHKVILTLKEAPVYYAPTVWDVDRDPLLVDNLPESHIFKAPAASKNELLRRLRENRLLIISDGTGEPAQPVPHLGHLRPRLERERRRHRPRTLQPRRAPRHEPSLHP